VLARCDCAWRLEKDAYRTLSRLIEASYIINYCDGVQGITDGTQTSLLAQRTFMISVARNALSAVDIYELSY